MKIRGIEISIGIGGGFPAPHTMLGVIPLDIDVPEELTKTDWTPLELVVTLITSKGKHGDVIRIRTAEEMWDGKFQISQEMIQAAAAELHKRIDAQRACFAPWETPKEGEQS